MDFIITSDEEPFSYGSAIKTVAKSKRKAIAPQQALPRKPWHSRVLAQSAARINQIGVWNGCKCRNFERDGVSDLQLGGIAAAAGASRLRSRRLPDWPAGPRMICSRRKRVTTGRRKRVTTDYDRAEEKGSPLITIGAAVSCRIWKLETRDSKLEVASAI